MSDCVTEQVKKFVFCSNNRVNGGNHCEKLEIYIPELLQAGYSYYTWPSAPVLAWFLWDKRNELINKNIIELGSGTALPGILAAKCGANVTLTDSSLLPKSLEHLRRCVQLNNFQVEQNIRVQGLTWGLFLQDNNIINTRNLDYILSSDCFYEPSVFEDILVTVSYILENNPQCKFFCTYQERSSDWSIESLLRKWQLKCRIVDLENLICGGEESELTVEDICGDHTIHLLEITAS